MIHQALHEQTRCDIGKAPSPTVAIIDSQSVNWQIVEGLMRSKKVKGRKRHIVTDTIGIPLGVKVTDANVSDNQVAIELLKEVFSWQITIQLVCADWLSRWISVNWTSLHNRDLWSSHCVGLWSAPFLGSVGFAD